MSGGRQSNKEQRVMSIRAFLLAFLAMFVVLARIVGT